MSPLVIIALVALVVALILKIAGVRNADHIFNVVIVLCIAAILLGLLI
jgi:hypothetical protein